MFYAVEFEPEVEALVRFVEESDPATIVQSSVEKLRNGTPPLDLIRACALAIVRSTELPPNHHGGPVHAVCGVRAVHEISRRLPGELAYLPVVQHTALCNNHTHSPQMGPYVMPKLEPLKGTVGEIGTYHISDEALHSQSVVTEAEASDDLSATKAAFERSLIANNPAAAEHYFLWLLDHLDPGEALDQLLPRSIAGNNLDDHNFIYTVYTARALDLLGWDWANTLYRPAVRYQARARRALVEDLFVDFTEIEACLAEYELLECDIPERSTPAETARIEALGNEMGASKHYFDNVEHMARALRDGLSLQGAGEALSLGSALAYLSTSYGNPMDSHLHTGTNNRRYLLTKDGVSKRSKLLALLTGFTGPEVLLAESLLNWESNIEPDFKVLLPGADQSTLLAAICESIERQPWLDWRAIGVDQVVASDEVKETVALARQYAAQGYEPAPYFEALAEISCRDDYTEMHSLKHFQAIVDEYHAARAPFQWVHLVAAAKSAAVVHAGREHAVYERAKALLKH